MESFEIILGIGTLLILGFQLWILKKQTKIIDLQRKTSEEQAVYLIKKEDPLLDVQKKEYENDKIILNIFNHGKTKAVGVAIKTEAYIINPETKEENGQLFASTRGEWDIDKQFNFIDGNNKYALQPTFLEIYHDKGKYPEIEPNCNRKFIQEIFFGLYDKKGKFLNPAKNITFRNLLTLLKLNKILGCEIRISLVYKNLINKQVQEILLEKFYIMPSKLKSKFISELTEEEKMKGGMKYEPIHPFLKRELNIPKSQKTYEEINHCKR